MWREARQGYTPRRGAGAPGRESGKATMSTPFDTEAGRLNGWKEIALHLGKGTRTVQRWEKLYGLPVHRIGREGGEIVFAFRDEIDRWMAATDRDRNGDDFAFVRAEADGEAELPPAGPGASPTPTRRRYRWAVVAMMLGLGVVTLAVWPALRGLPAQGQSPARAVSRQPTTWRLANESLTVFDAAGGTLFEHRFGFPFLENRSSEAPGPDVSPPALIADIDGDGRNEVLVKSIAVDRADRRLYCFEADGRLRFVHQPTGTRRFGKDDYAEPWVVHRVVLTRGPDGAKRLWAVFIHGFLFPSVLQELDARSGRVRQEYWSNGFIEFVTETSWNGRPVVLVGAGNNDFRAAGLAVFPPGAVTGAAPSSRPAYACHNCPPGGPEAFFVFPSLCTTRREGQAGILEAWVERGDRIRVTLVQDGGTATYYTLGPDGSLLAAEISREFQARHALLERQGVLDHRFGPGDDRDMFPVRRWDGRRFVDLNVVPVVH
jgi:hypothetical protein